jgi:hypothetical protein
MPPQPLGRGQRQQKFQLTDIDPVLGGLPIGLHPSIF